MIDIKLKLERNKHYINYSSIFSRLLLLKNELEKTNSFLIVVENEKILNSYLKISNYLNIEINYLNNLSDLINITYNNFWKYIVTKELFNIKLESFSQIEYNDLFRIKIWESIQITNIIKKLNELWYIFSDYENKWTFKIVWDILSFTDLTGKTSKISFWWDVIEEIISDFWKKEKLYFWKNKLLDFNNIQDNLSIEVKNKIYESNCLIILDSLDFYSSYDDLNKDFKNYIIFNSLSNNGDHINLWISELFLENIDDLKNLLDEKWIKKYIFTKNKNTIKNFLDLNNLHWVEVYETNLNNLKSFRISPEYTLEWFKLVWTIVITDDNISRIFVKKRIKRSLSKNLDLMMQIKPWDYIVHIDHGIWIFKEIVEKELSWIKKEYITLEYKNNDKLYVPITEVWRVAKYVWVENPKLTGLNTKEWEKKLKKVSEDVNIIAWELLELYAKRKLHKWYKFHSFPKDETIFANSFDYVYTDDQLHIIKEIYKDMESEDVMDRLLSWDVWFGKTEIAFASIYKAIINWKQAALISPLVVLAYEHYEKALERFINFPISIWVITRFEKPDIVKITLERLKSGKIDLIIWTHRLLSEDIQFKDLGLLIIDEEHKFWVKDKEKIKKFKWDIDILSMSATPIPRSLNMALNGLKSVSMLTTPPVGRQSIQTIVSSFDDGVIFEAWKREFERWGQMFFIHNRVETIDAMWNYLFNIFPWKKIAIVHGQLWWDKLEKRIIEFKRKQYDILLATTVVENWIDFPNVNTIFINEAQNFWISQIHQLRWRVWRSEKKWYCYLLFKKDKIKEDAAKRLKTIVDYSHLWAWFELAIKDLEIRWWWDILGIRQSGQWYEIWINLFIEMLEDKIEELKNSMHLSLDTNIVKWNIASESKGRINTKIDLNIWAYIDDLYFSSELDKINFYREIESLDNIEDLENIILDFKEINQNTPITTNNFFDLLKLKLKASKFKISSIRKIGINYQIDFDESLKIEELRKFLELDKNAVFSVITTIRLRSSTKNFANEEKFIQYILQLFDLKIWKNNIKFKKKL